MRSYIESRVNACGRIYVVVVTDDYHKPFQVCEEQPSGVSTPLAVYKTRTEAIKEACRLAVVWLTK